MPTDLQALNAQLDAAIDELSQTSQSQLSRPATDTAGKRFNQMRKLVKVALPDLASQLPDFIVTSPSAAPGPGVANASYLDVRMHLRELKAVIDDAITS